MSEKVAFNINNPVYVRLTEKAREYLREEYAHYWQTVKERGSVSPHYTPPAYIEPTEDAEGFTRFQFWRFMEVFGPVSGLGYDAGEYFKDNVNLFFDPRYFGALEPLEQEPPAASDPVDHPDHYNAGKVEAIDAIEAAVTGKPAAIAFNLGNAVKYIFRAGLKGDPVEDLEKAIWYIRRAIELYKEMKEQNK